ncbi:MAG: hypothetical protein IT357_18300 [Gemmatimonadaceae bacterium]|nr:hypothetical protein [Gemmatimonadaceae bacterium]
MSITTTSLPGRTLAALFALLSLACAKDSVVDPLMGAGCDVGALRPGVTRGALNESSCILSFNPWSEDRSAYAAHPLSVREGRAYMLTLSAAPDPDRYGRNDVDPILLVYGRAATGLNTLVAADDDAGRGRSSELFFIAPRGGTHRVIATTYGDTFDGDYLGGYALTLRECPVLSLNPDTGTTRFTLPESECQRRDDNYDIEYSFIRIPVAPYERITVTTTGTGFTPRWEAFGPDMDTHANLDGYAWSITGNAPTTMGLGDRGGSITLAVGALAAQSPTRQLTFTLRREIIRP